MRGGVIASLPSLQTEQLDVRHIGNSQYLIAFGRERKVWAMRQPVAGPGIFQPRNCRRGPGRVVLPDPRIDVRLACCHGCPEFAAIRSSRGAPRLTIFRMRRGTAGGAGRSFCRPGSSARRCASPGGRRRRLHRALAMFCEGRRRRFQQQSKPWPLRETTILKWA